MSSRANKDGHTWGLHGAQRKGRKQGFCQVTGQMDDMSTVMGGTKGATGCTGGQRRTATLRMGKVVLLWSKTDVAGTTRRRAGGPGKLTRHVGEGQLMGEGEPGLRVGCQRQGRPLSEAEKEKGAICKVGTTTGPSPSSSDAKPPAIRRWWSEGLVCWPGGPLDCGILAE